MAKFLRDVVFICKKSEEEIVVRKMRTIIREGEMLSNHKKYIVYEKTKILAKGPNPRVPHLDLPPELDNEDCHSTPWRQ